MQETPVDVLLVCGYQCYFLHSDMLGYKLVWWAGFVKLDSMTVAKKKTERNAGLYGQCQSPSAYYQQQPEEPDH